MDVLSRNPADFCFFDTETRSLEDLSDPRWGDITKTSALRYAKSSKVIMFQYAIGNAEPAAWCLDDFSKALRWADAPRELLEFMARALRGEAWFVAWNSAFDRHVCNHGMIRPAKRLILPVRVVLDAMAQGAAANLPGKLDLAHKAVGGVGKLPDGKHLIDIFCVAGGGTPQSHPAEWETFIDYGLQDIEALRDVFLRTRPLWTWEWEQFWTSEVINDRGLPIDRHYVERAAVLASEYVASVDERVQLYTGYRRTEGQRLNEATGRMNKHVEVEGIRGVNHHVALARWVFNQLERDHPEATAIMTRTYKEDEQEELVTDKIALDRKRVELLIPYLERVDKERGLTDDEYAVLQLLEVREYGASATPKKFAKMLPMLTDEERLPGQYVFNGAQQTGRFSSRGVQVHNLTRKALKDEEEAIEAICSIDLKPGRLVAIREIGADEGEDV